MVAYEVFLVERVLLDALVVLEAFEHNLAEAIEVRDITHLRIEELAHQCSRGFLVVDLMRLVVSYCGGPSIGGVRDLCTCVQRLMPYLTIRSLVIGAETLTMWFR